MENTPKTKILNGIECCTVKHDCGDCHYFQTDDRDADCISKLLRDAAEVIKTLSAFAQADGIDVDALLGRSVK